MKIDEMKYDHIMACALKCPIRLAKSNGSVQVDSGNWLAYPAKNEVVRRYRKACINDLRERELRGGSYVGDHGKVVIGGKTFIHYPGPSALIRQDFAIWIEVNWHKVLNNDGTERGSSKALRQDDVEMVPIARHALEAKMRAKDLTEPTELIRTDQQVATYDMEKTLYDYANEIERDGKEGKCYIVTKLQAALLAAMVQHRKRNYASSVDCFISVAAAALKAAEFLARTHSKEGAGAGGGGD